MSRVIDAPEGGACLLRAFVPGAAKPKGSLRPITMPGGRVRLVEEVTGSAPWRATLVNAIVPLISERTPDGRYALRRGYPHAGPVRVELEFHMPGSPGTYAFPIARYVGDCDKLIRNVLDALSLPAKSGQAGSGVYVDDSQVVDVQASKRWSELTGQPPGVAIEVWRMYG